MSIDRENFVQVVAARRGDDAEADGRLRESRQEVESFEPLCVLLVVVGDDLFELIDENDETLAGRVDVGGELFRYSPGMLRERRPEHFLERSLERRHEVASGLEHDAAEFFRPSAEGPLL